MINRILIVGYGSIGKRHLQIARQLLPQADIRLLRHKDAESVPEQADGCFFNIQDAISFSPQLSILANPAVFHIGVATQLAKAGSHLLIEKPISASIEGVENLIKLCEQKELTLLIGYNMRFLPGLQKFRELIHENLIGKVLSVRIEVGQYLPSWRSSASYQDGVSGKSALGGGVLLELSHELDYAFWIFGRAQWVRATLMKQSALDIDVEDTAHLIIGFESQNVQNYQLVASMSLDFIRHDTTRFCTAIGDKGSLRIDFLTGKIELLEPGESKWSSIFSSSSGSQESYLNEWRHLFQCIDGKESPLVTGSDGLRVLQLIEAIRESSVTGNEVKINYSLN